MNRTIVVVAVLAVVALLGSCTRNQPPEILLAKPYPEQIEPGKTTELMVSAKDPERGKLRFSWKSKDGQLSGNQDSSATWTAPDKPGSYKITVTVKDPKGAGVSQTLDVKVAAGGPIYSGSLNQSEGQPRHRTRKATPRKSVRGGKVK